MSSRKNHKDRSHYSYHTNKMQASGFFNRVAYIAYLQSLKKVEKGGVR